MKIEIIPILHDNYCYVIENNQRQAIIIDPGESDPILEHCHRQHLEVTTILITHHHLDHVGGLQQLRDSYPKAYVIDPENIQQERILKGDFGSVITYSTPGHTLVHACYLLEGHLFTGDLLFSLGCGRIFEGSYSQMYNSLNCFKDLPESTLIYPGHEYTRANCLFCQKLFAGTKFELLYKNFENNLVIGQPSIPTTLGQQRSLNPFLNDNSKEFIKALNFEPNDPRDFFQWVREQKDSF